jgi:hypothetical protein
MGKKICRSPEKVQKYIKYLASDGLTAPSKNIRKKFFRKT